MNCDKISKSYEYYLLSPKLRKLSYFTEFIIYTLRKSIMWKNNLYQKLDYLFNIKD